MCTSNLLDIKSYTRIFAIFLNAGLKKYSYMFCVYVYSHLRTESILLTQFQFYASRGQQIESQGNFRIVTVVLLCIWQVNITAGEVVCLFCQAVSSSYICHGVGSLVDPFRSHVSRSLFKDLP